MLCDRFAIATKRTPPDVENASFKIRVHSLLFGEILY